MAKTALKTPKMLEVGAPEGAYMGGSQAWYEEQWHRRAGCGPTTGSGMLWYLFRTRNDLSGVFDIGRGAKADFIRLMDKMFGYITPGRKGVNTTKIFTEGIARFSADHGISLTAHTLEISCVPSRRPSIQRLRDFVMGALERDLPVAFLNLSNGALTNLDNWHWVLITALDPETMIATMCDQGKTQDIDLAKWLATTALGGGFVVTEKQ